MSTSGGGTKPGRLGGLCSHPLPLTRGAKEGSFPCRFCVLFSSASQCGGLAKSECSGHLSPSFKCGDWLPLCLEKPLLLNIPEAQGSARVTSSHRKPHRATPPANGSPHSLRRRWAGCLGLQERAVLPKQQLAYRVLSSALGESFTRTVSFTSQHPDTTFDLVPFTGEETIVENYRGNYS